MESETFAQHETRAPMPMPMAVAVCMGMAVTMIVSFSGSRSRSVPMGVTAVTVVSSALFCSDPDSSIVAQIKMVMCRVIEKWAIHVFYDWPTDA